MMASLKEASEIRRLSVSQIDNMKVVELKKALKTIVQDPLETKITALIEEIQADRK